MASSPLLFAFLPHRRRLLAAAASFAALLAVSGPAHADRVIRIVVPFGAGATQDTVARTFSNELGQALGATVVVDNRAGAGGTVGTGQAPRPRPTATPWCWPRPATTWPATSMPGCPMTR